MSTSGLTTSQSTARDVIKHALTQLQVISSLQEPNAADEQFGLECLNDMLKDWQNDGVNLWRLTEYDIAWPGATSEVTITATVDQPNINDIIELRYVGSYERALERWEWGDYITLPNKDTVGAPNIFSVVPQLDATGGNQLRVRVWPVPADDCTLRGTVNRVIEDVTDANETLDVPQQYTRTVIMGLASYMASAHGKQIEGQAVIAEAARLYRIMRAADRPASYIFEGVR